MSFSDPSRAPYGLIRAPARRALLPPATLPVALALLLFGATGPNLLLALLSARC